MKRRNSIISDDIKDLYISVYLVGYEKEGESCIFVLHSKIPEEKILYLLVIDSYEDDNINQTLLVLDKIHKKRKLDMLIWTHPHDDHSIGLEKIISKRCNKDTKIITAEILNSSLPKYTKTCDSLITYINKKNKGKSFKNRWDIDSLKSFSDVIKEIKFTNGKDIIDKMIIQCISPYTNIGNVQAGLKNENINKLSIGIIIKIFRKDNTLNFLFSGDMDKQTIDAIVEEKKDEQIPEDEQIPSVYNYIKIPHHGSQSSSNLVKILDFEDKSELGCTTIFYDQDLPREASLKKYSNYIESLHCTANINENIYGSGIIEVIYDIKNAKSSISYHGVAKRITF